MIAKLKRYYRASAVDRQLTIVLMVMLTGFTLLSETIFTPSLPDIAQQLAISGNLAQATLSIYFAGFALGVGVWGAISDRVGRRPAMLAGLLFYVAGSFLCSVAPHIATLLAARFIQAFGASVGSVITMTMIRETMHDLKQRNNTFSIIAASLAFAPAIGPVLGGFIVQFFEWRANFAVLVIMGLFIFSYAYFKLPETRSDHISQTKINYFNVAKQLFRDPHIWACAILVGGYNSIMFSYYAEGPFIFMHTLGFTAGYYGLTGLMAALATSTGAFVSRSLNGKLSGKQIILIGCLSSLIGALMLSAAAWLGLIAMAHLTLSVCLLLMTVFLLFFGFGMVIPTSLSAALVNYNKVVGTAGSLFGLLYYVIVSLLTGIMASIHNGSSLPMPLYFVGLITVMLCSLRMFQSPR